MREKVRKKAMKCVHSVIPVRGIRSGTLSDAASTVCYWRLWIDFSFGLHFRSITWKRKGRGKEIVFFILLWLVSLSNDSFFLESYLRANVMLLAAEFEDAVPVPEQGQFKSQALALFSAWLNKNQPWVLNWFSEKHLNCYSSLRLSLFHSWIVGSPPICATLFTPLASKTQARRLGTECSTNTKLNQFHQRKENSCMLWATVIT